MVDKVTISTEHLKLGMFVSELDKPWVETPFMFQGFNIADVDDIAQLREHCKAVVIDVPQSSLPPEELLRIAALGVPKTISITQSAANDAITVEKKDVPEPDFKRTGQYYINTKAIGEELERAKEVEKKATRAVNDVLDRVRDGGKLEVDQLEEVVDPLVDSVLRNADAMSWLMRIREKDEYIYQHSIGASVWAVVFGRHLGFDKETLNAIGLGGMLLDVGKTKLPDALLRKAEPLTDKEQIIVRKHVELGLDVLHETSNFDPRCEIMLATHHERFDGSGYPNGLMETNIPVLGRLAGIVDSYDAMISQRPYAKTHSSFSAMRELQSMAGKGFQKEMVDQFVQAVGMFPTGSLVELNTGEVGIVTAQNNYQRLRPEVMIVLNSEKELCADFRTVDLRLSNEQDMSREKMWINQGLEPGAFGIDPAEYFL